MKKESGLRVHAKWLQIDASPSQREHRCGLLEKEPSGKGGCINGKRDPRGPATAAMASAIGFHTAKAPDMSSSYFTLFLRDIPTSYSILETVFYFGFCDIVVS